ncbi:uncharacterized protein RHOBADRAFT_16378 [Rhodotorula graminis WP1]|uniref:Uncharacterized protein n=1 Tax=Rhodotorula graminis (strain WP1) TaxID=578459 RepID=A0A0P9FE34_RHOGW|nr:uncharacterized protein RHOBADRAFT_16378 [Rhodotorula graminis WP1]KPV74032.1 hypothetical protein RHOBADRAFT_16378 [Rhodotorula graminis WP1]
MRLARLSLAIFTRSTAERDTPSSHAGLSASPTGDRARLGLCVPHARRCLVVVDHRTRRLAPDSDTPPAEDPDSRQCHALDAPPAPHRPGQSPAAHRPVRPHRLPLSNLADPAPTSRRLDEEVAAFVASVRPTKGEQRLRLAALTCLTKVVATLWPTAAVELFGSMATGLYLPHGVRPLLLLRTLRNALLASHLASTGRLVSHAKVPLVKLVTAPSFGSFAIDVSFNADKGPKGARESLRLLQELETRREGDKMRAKALVFVLKAFLDAQGLNEVRYGGLGGLGIFCLAVSFIQVRRAPFFRASHVRP